MRKERFIKAECVYNSMNNEELIERLNVLNETTITKLRFNNNKLKNERAEIGIELKNRGLAEIRQFVEHWQFMEIKVLKNDL